MGQKIYQTLHLRKKKEKRNWAWLLPSMFLIKTKKKILVVIENAGIWLVSNEKIERNQLKTLD